nr:hypothetical protein [Tanacetum cinerariifolium]
KMVDVNAPSGQAPTMVPPVRTDDQILPRIRCQLDEQWFVLTKDTLREALQITPVNNNQAFATPPTSEGLINFVNELGYPKGGTSFTQDLTLRSSCLMKSLFLDISSSVQRRYLAGETGSNPVSPTPKPTKPARKPKTTVPKAPPRLAVSTPVTSAQPAPISAPAKPQEKKRKQATETSNKPPKAKKSKYGLLSKKRTLKNVAASKAEDVPAMEPQVAAEDTDLQKALEESMKTTYALPRGPLPPVVIREPESGKYQPLPEVPRKGKAKVTEEQSNCEEESEKVVLGADEGGQDKGQAGPDPGAQAEDQTGLDASAHDEDQAGSNPDETSEGQVGPDPETLREALQITLVNRNQAFAAPPSIDGLIDFFNQLGYPNLVMNLSTVVTNDLVQPWRALLTIINLCLMGKTFGFERPKAPVLQIL